MTDLVRHFPRLYHMAEDGTWGSIRQHGLLSTEALLELFEVPEPGRSQLLAQRRPTMVPIQHDVHGLATIRDNGPLSETKLAGCLQGCSVDEFLRFLNRKVFLWLTEKRLQTMLDAYAAQDHIVIVVDTERLVERDYHRIGLSPINSGSTVYRAVPRGLDLFAPVDDYPFDERRRTRSVRESIAELVVDYGVADVEEVALLVERRLANGKVEVLWER